MIGIDTTLGGIVQWILAGLSTLVFGVVGWARRIDSRSKQNKRRLEGDPENDNFDGVLDVVSENNAKIDQLETKMEQQHKRVYDRVEDIADQVED